MVENNIIELNSPDLIKLRERFCKDTNIPIKIFLEPYFSYRLDLFNPMYGAKTKYENFMREIEGFDNKQEYFEFYNKVKDNAINSIKESEGFERFNNEDMNKYAVQDINLNSIRTKDIYKKTNDGKVFLSLDLSKANYSALKWYSRDIVSKSGLYEQFISQFCGDGFEHIIKSKYIRQVIFGNCNPKRQVTLEKYLMSLVIDRVILKYFDYDDIVAFQADEVVVEVGDKLTLHKLSSLYEDLMAEIVLREDLEVRMELFKLHNIPGTDYYYKKFFSGGSGKDNIELKCVDAEMMPFVLRALYNEDVEEEDKVLMHNGLLAKLLEIPKITF